MQASQLKYARVRLEGILAKRSMALLTAHTTPAVVLSSADRIAAIAAGAYATVFLRDIPYWKWHECFIFAAERDEVVATAELEGAQAKLDAEFTSIMDNLMLGDSQDALKAIDAFARGGPSSC